MMNVVMKKIFLLTTLALFYFSNSFAEIPHFIDFTKVLNNSKAGVGAQDRLKKKFETQAKKFDTQQAEIRKEESKIISQKKLITPEEYKKSVEKLRKRVADLQKNHQEALTDIGKSRSNAKKNLLTALSPIIRKYMEDNNIRLVFDKKSIILGDKTLEITDQIIAILNKKVLSIKIN
tara:strand:- start:415 stop:945 length:531 start_codon:yes stop_codon:yes gene_type:complete